MAGISHEWRPSFSGLGISADACSASGSAIMPDRSVAASAVARRPDGHRGGPDWLSFPPLALPFVITKSVQNLRGLVKWESERCGGRLEAMKCLTGGGSRSQTVPFAAAMLPFE